MSYSDIPKELIDKAPRKDVGIALKIVAIGIFILLLGLCLSFIMHGGVDISVTKSKAPVSPDKEKQ